MGTQRSSTTIQVMGNSASSSRRGGAPIAAYSGFGVSPPESAIVRAPECTRRMMVRAVAERTSAGVSKMRRFITLRHALGQFDRDRENAAEDAVAVDAFELADDQFFHALVEGTGDGLDQDAAVDVGDEDAAIAIAGDAGTGAVF